jgi:hypothetical protein
MNNRCSKDQNDILSECKMGTTKCMKMTAPTQPSYKSTMQSLIGRRDAWCAGFDKLGGYLCSDGYGQCWGYCGSLNLISIATLRA